MSDREAIARFPEGFEVWDRRTQGRPSRRGAQPAVALTAHGRITLDAATYAALGSPARVRLYVDRATGEIGIAAADGHGYRVSPALHRHAINATALCKALGIIGTARPLRATVEDGVLIAQTRQEGQG